MIRITVLVLLLLSSSAQSADSHSSTYAGQEHRAIKSLSETEISDLLSGKGMGLAKTAELNGYAGPKHVIELASQLHLTPDQLVATRELYRAMQSEARMLGHRIIQREQSLDQMFVDKTVSEKSLTSTLAELGELQARLRQTHLQAHLAQARILTPEQSERYAALRGYRNTAAGSHHQQHAH